MIEIDGSLGEGGGQILRSALALSLLTGKGFRLHRIRANRKPKPGLQAQHLASVRAATEIGHAKVTGDRLGSSELLFEPGPIRSGSYHFPIGTAGATSLVLHTVYLPLFLGTSDPSEVIIEGGTHVATSPCYDFLATTWKGYLSRMGFDLGLQLVRPGYYPRGGGRIQAQVEPSEKIQSLTLMQETKITQARIVSAVAGLPRKIADRQAKRAIDKLEKAGIEVESEIEEWPGGSATYLGVMLDETPIPTLFFALGAKDKSAEKVADEAVEQAVAFIESKCPVDPHSADQLLLPLSFSAEASEFKVSEVTRHLTTNRAILQLFLEREITIDGELGSTGIVRIAAGAIMERK